MQEVGAEGLKQGVDFVPLVHEPAQGRRGENGVTGLVQLDGEYAHAVAVLTEVLNEFGEQGLIEIDVAADFVGCAGRMALGEEKRAVQLSEGGDVLADEIGAFLRHEDGDGNSGAAMDEIDQARAGRGDDGFGAGEEGDLFDEREVFQIDGLKSERFQSRQKFGFVDDATAAGPGPGNDETGRQRARGCF